MERFWSHETTAHVGLNKVAVIFRFETVVVAENGANLPYYRLWLSYQNDSSLLFTVTLSPWKDDIVKTWGTAFPMVLRQLIEGTSLPSSDPRCCSINMLLDRESGALDFYVDIVSKANSAVSTAVHLPFRIASDGQFKAHLLNTVEELKEQRSIEKIEKLNMENEVKCLKAMLEQKERLCAWYEKQLQVFRHAYHKAFSLQPTEKSDSSQIMECDDSNCALPKCEETGCLKLIMSLPDEDEESIDVDQEDREEESADLKRSTASVTPTMPTKTSNNDLLLGIATYLFCSLCPEKVSLPDSDQMTQHFINEHVDDEKRQCRACPEESAKSPNDLISHVKIHTNRIYACKFCGKKGRKNYLKSHIRVHSGENPFVCSVCQRTFSDSSTLRRHQTVHTGEKKHSCPICGRNMSRKDNVRVHLKSHHKNLVIKQSLEQPSPSPAPVEEQ
ncbi:hypothetical protein L596_007137 [Steinernema carpocapsae]|uniref:C2H2-type domain-containing protein n=1 Tax=Steinernema carpocapsae TaxID=34508 RepID=A0A4U5P9D7_STECR|nr:hypothetical protein L596_007137 [Steinernema carpocapsae]